MNEVRINLPSTGWVTISEMTTGAGLTKLISVSSIVIAMNPSGIVENSSCTIICENATGYFTDLTAPDSPDRFLRGCDIEIFQQGELTFRGKISETPKPSSPLIFEIRADIFVNFDKEINLQLNKRTVPGGTAVGVPNKNKYGNIITGAMTENQRVAAHLFAENLYHAAWHYLYALTAAYKIENDQEVDITSQCTLTRDAFTGHTYIEYEGGENEIFIQASGAYVIEHYEINQVENGDMEAWLSSTNLAVWSEEISGNSTVSREEVEVYSGNSATRITTDADGKRAGIEISLTLTPYTHHRLRIAYLLEEGKTITVVLRTFLSDKYLLSSGLWDDWDIENMTLPEIKYKSGWAIYEIEFITPDDTDYILLIRRTYQESNYSFLVDSVEITAEKNRVLIENPADMFSYICKKFSNFSVDTDSIDTARAIYMDRQYEGNCSIVISNNLKWKDFFRKYFENFETYIDTCSDIALIVPNLGLELAQSSIHPIYVDWAKFLFWYDYPQVWGSILTHFKYSPKENQYLENLETKFNESGHSGEKKELFLCYHNREETALDIAGKYAYRRRNPPIRYEFRLPEIIGKGIQPGQIIQLEAMRKGFFLGENRLCFVHRKRKEKSGDEVFFVFVCEDITILSDRVLLLHDENSEECETLKDQDAPECHLLL